MVNTTKALCLHGRYSPQSSKMRKFCDYFLILPYFLYFIILISCLQNYYISSDPPNHSAYFLHLPPIFCIKPTFLHEKRRSPALIYFTLGCQRRVAPPNQTKDYPRIVILVDNNSYLTLFERSLRVRLSNTTPLFLYIFAGLIEPVFL